MESRIAIQAARLRENSAYRVLDCGSVISYLGSLANVERRLGGAPAQWQADECGDGNLNLVFIVHGPTGSVVVKQALPYVRMVGESWPLSIRRNFFEDAALREQARWAARFVPAVYHSDDAMALIVMEFLSPHKVLRAGFIDARLYPRVGSHLGQFLAQTLFNTSDLRLSASAKKERVAIFLSNTDMCQISEDLIFDEPYFSAPMNRHTSPHLDSVATELASDTDLKVAVQAMKWRFMNQPECLIHGDLHTGSVMVTAEDTRVIDPEFAFYGPMGFDMGVLLANFLMAYFSQLGHSVTAGDRKPYRSYLLDQVTALWATFATEFASLWHARSAEVAGDLCHPRLAAGTPAFSGQALGWRLEQIWRDALGFAGCEIIRRIMGLAHVADFEAIVDPDRRARCEGRAVQFARGMLLECARWRSVSELTTSVSVCG